MISNDRSNIGKGRMTAAGAVWFSAVQFFITQIAAQRAWTTEYSLSANFISDLGNTTCGPYQGLYVCSPWHVLMNISFSLQGVIILSGAILARPLMRSWRTGPVVFSLFVLTAFGMIGVGAFPENVYNDAHVIAAGIQFVTGNTALIIIGLSGKYNLGRVWYALSIVLGVTGLISTALFASGYGLGLGVGGMERVAAYTFPIWLMGAGGVLAIKALK